MPLTERWQFLAAALLPCRPLLSSPRAAVLQRQDLLKLSMHVLVTAADDELEQLHHQLVLVNPIQHALYVLAVSRYLREARLRVHRLELAHKLHQHGELAEDVFEELPGNSRVTLHFPPKKIKISFQFNHTCK